MVFLFITYFVQWAWHELHHIRQLEDSWPKCHWLGTAEFKDSNCLLWLYNGRSYSQCSTTSEVLCTGILWLQVLTRTWSCHIAVQTKCACDDSIHIGFFFLFEDSVLCLAQMSCLIIFQICHNGRYLNNWFNVHCCCSSHFIIWCYR